MSLSTEEVGKKAHNAAEAIKEAAKENSSPAREVRLRLSVGEVCEPKRGVVSVTCELREKVSSPWPCIVTLEIRIRSEPPILSMCKSHCVYFSSEIRLLTAGHDPLEEEEEGKEGKEEKENGARFFVRAGGQAGGCKS